MDCGVQVTRHRLVWLGIVFAAAWGPMTAPGADTCASLDACIERMRVLARGRELGGLGPEDTALIKRITEFGDVVPRLIPFLKDPDEGIADFTGAVLRDVERIDARYLPEIRAGLDRGLGWLPPALGRIDDPAAAREAVQRFLVSDSAPHNQEAYAVKLCGKRALPYIIEAASCAGGCRKGDHGLLSFVLHELPPDARASAAPGLMNIVRSEGTAPDVARGVLLLIGALAVEGRSLESDLVQLRELKPALKESIDQALVGIHSHKAGGVFAQRLRRMKVDGADARLVLRDVGETGKAAHDAGPEIVRLLDDPDWETRIAAARALGFIGYQPAVPALAMRLRSPEDVRLNWVAAESLGRIGDPAASAALRSVADTHWYPPVKKAAAQAIEHITGHSAYELRYNRDNFAFEFFEYQSIGDDSMNCPRPGHAAVRESREAGRRGTRNPRALQKLAYPTIVVSYGAEDDTTPDKDGVTVVTSDNLVRHEKEIRQIPDVALRVDGGWVAGSSRGEWGGELVFLGDDKSRQRLLDENVHALYRLGDRIVALTGLAHLFLNDGVIHELTTDPAGTWQASPWRVLPGAPGTNWLTESGELLIDVRAGGTILVAPDGSMRMAPCGDR
jgi:hypothetical protein